jgi:hypothetical protein
VIEAAFVPENWRAFAPGQAESYCARTGALPAVCLESFARRTDRVMKATAGYNVCAINRGS